MRGVRLITGLEVVGIFLTLSSQSFSALVNEGYVLSACS